MQQEHYLSDCRDERQSLSDEILDIYSGFPLSASEETLAESFYAANSPFPTHDRQKLKPEQQNSASLSVPSSVYSWTPRNSTENLLCACDSSSTLCGKSANKSSVYGSKSPITSSIESFEDQAHFPQLPPRPPKSSRPGCFNFARRVRDAIYRHVDPKALLEIIDIREYFWPFSWKKYAVLLLVFAAVAGIVISDLYFRWIEKSMAITRRYMLPVLVIVIALEPMMATIVLLVARMPLLDHEAGWELNDMEKKIACDQDLKDHRTALVIPCHKSDEGALQKVLESAYRHFRPQDIFIVDNARSKYPVGNLRSFIRRQHPDIQYIWSPIGSKTAAQFVGALAAKEYEFIMTVDDDVSIPTNFRPPIDKIDAKTKGVAFPLKAIDSNGKRPLFMVAWQDAEYRMAGLTKLAESSLCGVLYPHGAGWFCDRQTLIDLVTGDHSIDFIADDVNIGLSMQKMKKKIGFDARVVLETEVPTTILGPGLNWWKQRKNSWEMGRHGRLFAFAGRLLLSFNGQTTPHGVFAQKFLQLYTIATIAVDWTRLPVLITLASAPGFWLFAGCLSLVPILPLLAYKYLSCRHRPDMEPRFWACITYPIYTQLYSLVSICGAIRSVMFYIGGHQRPKRIKDMIAENDERAFWLDSRFETNPAYLADEAEAIQAQDDQRADSIDGLSSLSAEDTYLDLFPAKPKRSWSSSQNVSSENLSFSQGCRVVS